MSKSYSLTRRTALGAAAALPFASAALPAMADGHSAMTPNANKRSFGLGNFEVSVLLAGTRTVENPQEIFGKNVSSEEFAAASAANFLPTDKAQFFFHPTVVRTGNEVVLFDTGLNPASITAPLMASGIAPEDVTIVVLTHMHGDHIGGLMGDGGLTFPNARYVTGQVEFDAWAAMENERFDGNVKPLADNMTFIGDGGSVTSGITGMAAFGHTPGHMTYMLESEGEQLVLIADTANHYVWSLAYPDWEVRFDRDKAAAAATRRNVFGMLAADKIPFVGYHMPFPALGYVETATEGEFRYVPSTYQMML